MFLRRNEELSDLKVTKVPVNKRNQFAAVFARMHNALETTSIDGSSLPEERSKKVRIAKSCPASKTNDDKVSRGRNINALTVRADHGYQVGRRVF